MRPHFLVHPYGLLRQFLINQNAEVVDFLVSVVVIPFHIWHGEIFEFCLDGHFSFDIPFVIGFIELPFFWVVFRQISRPAAICFGRVTGKGEVADEVFSFFQLLLLET